MDGEGSSWGWGWYDGTAEGLRLWGAAGFPGGEAQSKVVAPGTSSYVPLGQAGGVGNDAFAAAGGAVPSNAWTLVNYPPVPNASGPGAATAFTGVPRGSGTQAALVNPLANPNEAPVASFNACNLLPAGTARDICLGIFKPSTPTTGTTFTPPSTTCPAGYHKDAAGRCAQDGISPYIPGDVGKPDYVWTPVNGRFGQGVTPVAVQSVKRACPSGMVLGKDGVCYDHLARTNRAHNPGTKPLLTGGDMNALRKAKALEKRWRKVAPAFHKKVVNAGARLVKAPKRK